MFLVFILIAVNFVFTEGSHQLILSPGQYKVFCYGAQGGAGFENRAIYAKGGKGAYVSGTMTFGGNKTIFYAFVGGQGLCGEEGPNAGGFNGGGSGGKDKDIFGMYNDASGGGGGATDLRIDDDSINSRIIVAAGGSGAVGRCEGSPGGCLTGFKPIENNVFVESSEVTQTEGNIDGVGGNGIDSPFMPGSGGGGGWRGGVSSDDYSVRDSTNYKAVAHSGSSYISGYPLCARNFKISFTDNQMTAGIHSGNGKLMIEINWECSLANHSCTNGTILVKCFDGFFEHDNKCVSRCPPGYIEVNKKCTKCTGRCATCQNSISKCTSCLTGFLYNNECVLNCPTGTVNTGTSCVKCKSENGNCSSLSLINESQIIELKSGRYRVKCKGAQGGQSYNFSSPFKSGGQGAYVTGVMNLEGTETAFYVNIGKMGQSSMNETNQGGQNGGGKGGKFLGIKDKGFGSSGGGGGATDIRIYDNSTRNRIIVASGGSGASFGCQGAPGGALTGMVPIGNDNFTESEQTNQNPRKPIEVSRDGLDTEHIPQSGGGGGFFGGLAANQIGKYGNESWKSVSESGNSYLSGFEGCVNHPFITFEEGEMISGYNAGNGNVEIQTEFECPFNCYSCTNGNKCTKCIDNYFLFDEGTECVSKCPVDYSGIDGKCVKCSSPCDTCSLSPTTCTSCIENYNLYNNKCQINCPSGTYSVGILPAGLECRKCKSPCLTCSKFVDYCLSCVEGYYLLNNECISRCPDGTIPVGNECHSCLSSCSKCADSINKCTECKSGYYLNGNECVSKCPVGMTQTKKYCVLCESPANCSKSIDLIRDSQKFTLKSGVYKVELLGGRGGHSYNYSSIYKYGGRGAYVSGIMQINGSGTTFYSNVGSMGHSSLNKTNPGCTGGGGAGGKYDGIDATGISSSGGGGGASDLRINDNSTNNRIIVAAGGSGAAGGCAGAPGGALTGFKPISNDNFIESDEVDQYNGILSGIGQSGTTASTIIPISGGGGGYRGGIIATGASYNAIDSWKSVSHSGSSYISGYTGCEIHNGMVFTDTIMKPGYYDSGGYISITPQFECSYKCSTCLNETVCTSCLDDYILYNNQCVRSCPSGSILMNGKCELCDQSCISCQGSITNCTLCKVGYYFYQNMCVTKCPEGFVGVNRVCEQCLSPCQTCTELQTKCKSCMPGFYLYGEECVNICPLGYFKSNGACQKCDSSCKTCTSASSCLECQENYYFYKNKCLRSCPDGYIEINNQCEKCTSPCQTCKFAQDACTSCESNLYLYKMQCLQSCPNGTIEVNHVCEPCILPCKTCQISQTKCQVCIEGYYLYDGECVEECPEGYVEIDRFCEKCQENCSSCQNSITQCTQCKDGFYLFENTCVLSCPYGHYIYEDLCISACPKGTFASDGKCEKCDYSCETCSVTKDHCDICSDGFLFYDNHCYVTCEQIKEDGYFGKDDENQECRKCSTANCVECSINYSICTECSENFYLDSNKCFHFPSSEFTNSNEFSGSQKFTQSKLFSDTSKFTQTSPFSETSKFTQTSPFSETSKFTQTSPFSETSKFTQTSPFSETSKFTQTSPFSDTLKFTQTSPFSVSYLFTNSKPFSMSHAFMQSKQFSHSKIFTTSLKFTKSSQFSLTFEFTQSSSFSESSKFSASSCFTNSLNFNQTAPFTPSSIFTSSSKFTKSPRFSESSLFTQSFLFTKSNNFESSQYFKMSDIFTKSMVFTKSPLFTQSSLFTKNNDYESSQVIELSDHYTESYQLANSITLSDISSSSFQFSKSSYFSYSHEFSKSSSFSCSSAFTQDTDFKSTQLFISSPHSTKSPTLLAFTESTNWISLEIISESSFIITEFPKEIKTEQDTRSKGNKIPMIIGISIAILIIIISSLIILLVILKKKKQNEQTTKIVENNQESDIRSNENVTSNIQYQNDSDRDLDFWL